MDKREHVDPLIGGLRQSGSQNTVSEGMSLKWRVVIAVAVLVALVVIISHQAF